jgi:hypothetical protein
MLKRLTLFILSLSVLLFSAWVLQPSLAFASSPKDEICKGVGAATGAGCTSGISLTRVIRNVINIFSILIGVVAVIMIIVAGFKYVTSGGDSGSITSAKQTLVYAIVGLVVTALSQAIVRFVLDRVT